MAAKRNQDEDNPICAKCGDSMLFACREAEPGFETRTFQCGRCFSVEQFKAAVRPKMTVDENVA
jgi:ribosomal protein S27AE